MRPRLFFGCPNNRRVSSSGSIMVNSTARATAANARLPISNVSASDDWRSC